MQVRSTPRRLSLLAGALLATTASAGFGQDEDGEKDMANTTVHGFTVKDIDGKEVALSTYEGDVLLIVNVASK